MKKIMMMMCFVAIGFSYIHAQNEGGQGNRQGGERMRAMTKERMKEELKFTDVQIDTIMNVQQDFQAKSRAIRQDEAMSADDKAAKVKELNDARKAKLKGVLSDSEIEKLDAFYENMRRNRPGGGGPQ